LGKPVGIYAVNNTSTLSNAREIWYGHRLHYSLNKNDLPLLEYLLHEISDFDVFRQGQFEALASGKVNPQIAKAVKDGQIKTSQEYKAMEAKLKQAELAKEEAERRAEQAEQANEALTVQYDEQAEQLQNLRNNPQVVEVQTGITQEQLDKEIKKRTDAEHLLMLEKNKPVATPHDYEYTKRRNVELERELATYKAHEEGMTLQQKAEIDAEVAKYKNTASQEIQKSIKMGDLISAIHNLPKNMEVADFAESYVKQERGAEERAKADIRKLIIDLQTIHDELDKYINKTERLRVVK
jgi:hypothetical protein